MHSHEPAVVSAGAVGRRFLTELADLTADPPGVTRKAYGKGEQAGFDLAARTARAWGAEIHDDAAGNRFILLAGEDGARDIVIGSHLDSVPHGGDFDGAAGVAVGLSVQAALAAADAPLPLNLVVACLRAEESCWFPHSYIGSKTALGRLDPTVLDSVRRSDSGETLATHMALSGFDPSGVARDARWLEPDRIAAFVEPHIEQGPVLVDAGRPIGLVSAIRGSFRYRSIAVRGAYAHSGTTPRALRRDAAIAGALLMMRMDALWADMEREGHDLTVTFGEMATDVDEHSFSKVAGALHLCLDVRSESKETLDLVEARLRAIADEIADARNVEIDLGPRTSSAPAVLDRAMIGSLARACEATSAPWIEMPSGAGHDAATFAHAGLPTAMIFIRNRNGSHNPDEAMAFEDMDAAIAVLVAFVRDAGATDPAPVQ